MLRVVARSLSFQMRSYAERITMPALSPTMETGIIAEWRKKAGDRIQPGDVLCQIETDKATLDFEWVGDTGYIAKLLCDAHTDPLPVGSPIAVLVEEESEIAEAAKEATEQAAATPKAPEAAPATSAAPVAAAPAAATPAPSATQPTTSSTDRSAGASKVRASPAALSLMAAHIQGSGPQGRITQADVDQFLATRSAAGAQGGSGPSAQDFVEIPVSMMRRTIASRLTESKNTVPHFYLTIDVEATAMKQKIKELNDHANGAYKLSLNDYILKASALACRQVPTVLSQWHETVIKQFTRIDLSVAVATPSGLITPIVFNADLKGLREISEDVKSLATLARDGKLTPEQYTGGNFTVSNLGGYGIKHFTAIINPPQACILAVGAIQNNGRLSVTLSCDHRVVDGAVGATWLQAFKQLVEQPNTLLL
eukprot:NODE_1743_length_1395_cov_15.772082_g1655_i0.p1 GENE.NODE_1743_length_1395_cov_15.772082_g1655_i0~~NODE_1743_length_1395_cov_15.772082_g1655_i0.p1  ORF type:complete len:448 (-),score=123.34 NODE_1743_length_1395_cov_15.772082_g1655_i0:52-1326(-)